MNMYPQMETPGGTCTPKQKYEWACCLIVLLKEYFEKVTFEKSQANDHQSMKNYLACKE